MNTFTGNGEGEKHQLSVTVVFHLIEQMVGCQKDEIFYSYHILLQITYMSVFCENFMHLHVTFFIVCFSDCYGIKMYEIILTLS